MGKDNLLPFVTKYLYIYLPILISLTFLLSIFDIDKKLANICGMASFIMDDEFVRELFADGKRLYEQGKLNSKFWWKYKEKQGINTLAMYEAIDGSDNLGLQLQSNSEPLSRPISFSEDEETIPMISNPELMIKHSKKFSDTFNSTNNSRTNLSKIPNDNLNSQNSISKQTSAQTIEETKQKIKEYWEKRRK